MSVAGGLLLVRAFDGPKWSVTRCSACQGRLVSDDERWQLVQERALAAEPFVYAVRTTMIYCRSTCPARRPRRENVLFFDGGQQARSAGYRPCLRCQPDNEPGAAVELAGVVAGCRAMVAAAGPLPRPELERVTGLAGRRLGRAFQRVIGVSPRAFGDAVRTGAARALLRQHGQVSQAVYASGFGSVRAFYDTAATTLGMTPSAYAAGADGEQLLWGSTSTPVGCLLAVASIRGLCAVRIGPDVPALLAEVRAEFPAAQIQAAPGVLDDVLRALAVLAGGGGATYDLPVDLRGTAFQARVWTALRLIPAGQTRSYRQVAEAVGSPAAIRAVASACATNRVALVVPCHRVLRSDGGLGGFRWGLEVKQALLDAEHAALDGQCHVVGAAAAGRQPAGAAR